SSLLLRGVQDTLSDTVHSQLTLISRMAERWNSSSNMPSATIRQTETLSYLRDDPGMYLIAVVDASRTIVRSQDPGSARRQWLDEFLARDDTRAWLDHVQDSNAAHMSPSHADRSGIPHHILAVPLQTAAMDGWTLIAAQNLSLLLRDKLNTVAT